jgi:hypothetical protein
MSSAHYGSVGRRVGLGLVLEKTAAGISIKDLVPGLAAERSGQCRRGDGLLAIDGRSLQNYDLDQVISACRAACHLFAFYSAACLVFRRFSLSCFLTLFCLSALLALL